MLGREKWALRLLSLDTFGLKMLGLNMLALGLKTLGLRWSASAVSSL